MRKLKIFLTSFVCLLVPGCNSNSIDFYRDKKEKINMREFFNGDVEGWGTLFDFWGRQTRSFYVYIKGDWQGNTGTLDEVFDFDDGERSTRKWDVSFKDNHHFTATAHDVIGEAKGEQKGNAINLNYVLEIPYNNSTLRLSMDDWMYKTQGGVIINRTSMRKFGFKVGELVLVMKKVK